MMPRLVGPEDLGGLPTARTNRPIVRIDNSATADAATRAGNVVTNVGFGLAQKWQAADDLGLQAKYQEFTFNEDKAYAEATRNMQPGQAQGFADTYTTGYRARAKDFLATVPDRLKPAYDANLFDYEQKLYGSGLGFETTEQRRAALATISDTIGNTFLPKMEMAAALPEGDPNKLNIFNRVQADGLQMIDANPALSPIEKETAKKDYRAAVQTAFLKALPASERLNADPNHGAQTVGQKIIAAESGGNPDATNANSSAVGAGQFTEATWLDLIKRARPDLAQGKSDADILALRTDPALSEEMVNRYASENTAYLTNRGQAATPGNLYLAHFLGPEGAVAMLGADAGLSAAMVNPKAAEANPTVFYHAGPDGKPDMESPKSVAEVSAWASEMMSGATHVDWASQADAVPYEDKVAIGIDAGNDLIRQNNAAATARQAEIDAQVNDLKFRIDDGKAGYADVAAARQAGWLTNADTAQALVKRISERDKEGLNLAAATQKVANPAYRFNQFSKDDKDAVNLFYDKGAAQAGVGLATGDAQAIQTLRGVVERTNIVPSSASDLLQSGIWSSNASERDTAFSVMDGLYRQNPQAVRQAFPEDAIARLQDYQQLASLLPPDELDKHLNPALNPAEAERRNKLRGEGEKIYRGDAAHPGIDIGDVLKAFDPTPGSFFSWNDTPAAPRDPIAAASLNNDFMALFAERYSITGQKDVAEAQALERLKGKWGVSNAGPHSYVMAYPPENYYPVINGSHDWMDEQLGSFVTAQVPDAQDYFPIATPDTEAVVSRNRSMGTSEPVPYQVAIIDKDGVFRVLTAPNSAQAVSVAFDPVKAAADAQATFELRRQQELQRRARQNEITRLGIAAGQTSPEVQGMPTLPDGQ